MLAIFDVIIEMYKYKLLSDQMNNTILFSYLVSRASCNYYMFPIYTP